MTTHAWIPAEGLPSKKLPYAEGTEISYRMYTYGEMKLASQAAGDLPSTVALIIKGIRMSKGTPDDLTLGDFLFLSLMRKLATTQSEFFSTQWVCACGHSNQTHASVEELEFTDIRAESLPLIRTISDRMLQFSPLTITQFVNMTKKDPVSLMAAQCQNVPFEQAYQLIYDSTEGDILDDVDNLLYHSPEPLPVTCSKCKAKGALELLKHV